MAELKGNYFVDMAENSPMRSEAVSLVTLIKIILKFKGKIRC